MVSRVIENPSSSSPLSSSSIFEKTHPSCSHIRFGRSIDKGRGRKRASLSLTGERNFSKRRGNASMRLLLFISLFFFSRTGEKALALPFLGVRKRRISPVLSGGRRVGRWRRSARRRNWLSHRRVITGYYGVLAGRAATTDNHSSPRRGEKRDRPARESRFSTLRSSRRIPGTNATRGKPNEWQHLAGRGGGGGVRSHGGA